MRSLATVSLAALVMVGLAGCLDETGLDDLDPVGTGLLADWQAPIFAGPGGDAETSVHAGPDGVVLACSHGGFQMASPAWSSLDGGQTWTRLVIEPNPLVSGDCDMAILDDGTWVIVFDTIASATIATSQDEGASWSFNYLSALPIAVDRPWITHTGNRIHMIYADVMAVEPALNMYAYSDDHGVTWTHNVMAAYTQDTTYYTHVLGDLIVRDDGIFAPITRGDMSPLGSVPWSIQIRHSADGGATWTWKHVVELSSPGLPLASLDDDASGRLWTVIPEGRDDGMAMSLAWSDDAGDSWTSSDALVTGQDLPGVTGPALVGMDHTSGVAVAWMNYSMDGWHLRGFTADLVDGHVVMDGPHDLSHAGGSEGDLYEFIDVDVDDQGNLYAAFILDDSDACWAGVSQQGRNGQCMYITPGQWTA